MNSFIIIILGIVVFMLHIYLCRKENKFLGLIIPGINILLSVSAIIGIAMYDTVKDSSAGIDIIQFVLIFIMYNIPTVILLSIYFSSRKNLKCNKEINKMNIKDLN